MDLTTVGDFNRCHIDFAPVIINRPSCSPGMYQARGAILPDFYLASRPAGLCETKTVIPLLTTNHDATSFARSIVRLG